MERTSIHILSERRLIHQNAGPAPMPRPESPMPELTPLMNTPQLKENQEKLLDEPRMSIDATADVTQATENRINDAGRGMQEMQKKIESRANASEASVRQGLVMSSSVMQAKLAELKESEPPIQAEKSAEPTTPQPSTGPESVQPQQNPDIAQDQANDQMKDTALEVKNDIDQLRGEPKDHAEKLSQQFDDALKTLEKPNLTKGEALKAIMQIISTVVEFFKRAFDGTLDDALNQKDVQEAPAPGAQEAPEEQGPNTPRTRVVDELQQRPDPKDVEGLKQEKVLQREQNDKDIRNINTAMRAQRTANEDLIEKENAIQKNINGIRGEPGSEEGLRTLETQLKAVRAQMKAGQEALDDLETQRDELTARNEQLDEEIEAVDDVAKDVERADQLTNRTLKKALDVLAKRFPEMPMPTVSVVIKPDGTVKVKISGMDDRDTARITGAKNEPDGSVELDEKDAKKAADDLTSNASNPDTSNDPNSVELRAAFDDEVAAPLEEQSPGFKKTRLAADAIRTTVANYGAEYMDPSVMDQLVADLNAGYAEYIADHGGNAVPQYALRYADEITEKMEGLEGNTPKPRLIINNTANTFSVQFESVA